MSVTSIENFKSIMISIMRAIVEKGDAKGASDKAKIEKLSADLSAANALNIQLQEALAAKDEASAKALADQSATLLADLDTFSTEFANEFNPTSTADAVAEAVAEAPEIETPDEVEDATTIGSNEPTPPEVAEAAITAIEEAADE